MANIDSKYFPGIAFPAEQIADALEGAADYMDQHGWTVWNFENNEGSVCLRGALAAVTEKDARGFWSNPMACAADNVMSKYLRKHGMFKEPSDDSYLESDCPAMWNNKQKDKYAVVDAMKHAAKELRNGEIS